MTVTVLPDEDEHTRLLDAVPDPIFRFDHNLRVQYMNQAAARGLPAVVLGMHVDEFAVLPAHRGRWRSSLVRVLTSGVAERFDMDGAVSARRYDVSLVRLARLGAPGVVVVMRDITERRSLERKLLHEQRLETLGTLAGGIAHDLNNILMPILMGCEVLKHVGVPPGAEPTLERIEGSARRGADVIRQLLTFTRGYRKEGEPSKPAAVVAEAAAMLQEIIPPSIAIETEVEPDVWSVACDATQVLQLLLNLGVNARDAMPDGGLLSLRAGNVEADGAYVLISVSDTGTGIAPELMERIFEPFFTTKGAGTGLGLTTVRSILKNHGGFLRVSSEPGATVFKVYLPVLAG